MKGQFTKALRAGMLLAVLGTTPGITFGQATEPANRDYNANRTDRTTDTRGFNPGWLGLAGLIGLLGLIGRNNNHTRTHDRPLGGTTRP